MKRQGGSRTAPTEESLAQLEGTALFCRGDSRIALPQAFRRLAAAGGYLKVTVL